MIATLRRMPLAPLGLGAALVACALVSAAEARDQALSLPFYLIANAVVILDGMDFLLRLLVQRRRAAAVDPGASGPEGPKHPYIGVRPYAILVSVYNLEDRLDDFMEWLGPHREQVWIISDGSLDQTALRLRQAGWRCVDDGIKRQKPGAIAELLRMLPARIVSVLVIDPDIRFGMSPGTDGVSLERIVLDFQRSGAAAVCPRIRIARDGFVGRFQALEYALAFGLGRRSLGDCTITSGVSLYRRDALQRALERHSRSIYAEDLENALILLRMGESIYFDGRLVVDTEGPAGWSQWLSQRVGWYYGLLKVYVERFAEIRRISGRGPFAAYHYLFYMGFLTVGMHLLKMLSLVMLLGCAFNTICEIGALGAPLHIFAMEPGYLGTATLNYLVFMTLAMLIVVPRDEWDYAAPILPLYFFYALAQIAPITLGFGNWLSLRAFGRRLYRDHYERTDDAVARPPATGRLPVGVG